MCSMHINMTVCESLARQIGRELENGLRIGADVVDYIESTHGQDCLKRLPEYLTDPEDAENETLTALVFTPDESFQVQIETFVSQHVFNEAAKRQIIEFLKRNPPDVTLSVPSHNMEWRISLPPNAVEDLLSGLNITRQLPESLIRIVIETVPDAWRNTVLVRFRNASFHPTQNRIDFFERYFTAFSPETTLFFPCLDLVLTLFEENAADNSNPLHLLRTKKRTLLRHAQIAESCRKKLDRSNMETLMLTGNRMPYVDLPDVRRQLQLMDIIAEAIYGRGMLTDEASGTVKIRKDVSATSLKEIIQFLS